MKKICGFKSLDGQFYEKEQDCKIADIEFEIRETIEKLDNFSIKLKRVLWDDYLFNKNKNRFEIHEYILEIVAKVVLKDSKTFLDIIAEKEKLRKHLEELYLSKKHCASWWMKIKWWS